MYTLNPVSFKHRGMIHRMFLYRDGSESERTYCGIRPGRDWRPMSPEEIQGDTRPRCRACEGVYERARRAHTGWRQGDTQI